MGQVIGSARGRQVNPQSLPFLNQKSMLIKGEPKFRFPSGLSVRVMAGNGLDAVPQTVIPLFLQRLILNQKDNT